MESFNNLNIINELLNKAHHTKLQYANYLM